MSTADCSVFCFLELLLPVEYFFSMVSLSEEDCSLFSLKTSTQTVELLISSMMGMLFPFLSEVGFFLRGGYYMESRSWVLLVVTLNPILLYPSASINSLSSSETNCGWFLPLLLDLSLPLISEKMQLPLSLMELLLLLRDCEYQSQLFLLEFLESPPSSLEVNTFSFQVKL